MNQTAFTPKKVMRLVNALAFAFLFSDSTVEAFGARLVRPWELETCATRQSSSCSSTIHVRRDYSVDFSSIAGSKRVSWRKLVRIRSKPQDGDEKDEPAPENQDSEHLEIFQNTTAPQSPFVTSSASPPTASTTTPSTTAAASKTPTIPNLSNTVNGAVTKPVPSVRSSLGPLLKLVRPANFPGVVLFHMVGVRLALQSTSASKLYWGTLLHGKMWLVLAALLLTSSTSMVVNDYYDAKLGRDVADTKALVHGDVSLQTARRFLSYLYGVALLLMCVLPGVETRLAVVVGLMLTYFYTQSLKPVTWLKNVVCAALIALSPWTSGAAALHVTAFGSTPAAIWMVPSVWRLTGMLFFGICGREILMDCNDVVVDEAANVQTVPVVHGRRFASRVAAAVTAIMAMCSIAGPVWQLTQVQASASSWRALATSGPVRRLVLATLGSAAMLRRSWQVVKTEGSDVAVVSKAVDEGLLAVIILLASFV